MISSIKDERVVLARELLSSKGRRASRKFLIEGEEAIQWALSYGLSIEYIFIHDKQTNHPLLQKKIPYYFTTEGVLKKISDTSYLIPFIAVAAYPESNPKPADMLILFDRVKDFGNIGTIVRTASAFGIHRFASTEPDFDLYYKKTIDASRGAVFQADLKTYPSGMDAIRELKKQGYQIVVTSSHESTLHTFAPISSQPIAIVFGNETDGIDPALLEQADLRIRIPMSGHMESLNVGVAAGISLYEMKIKGILSMLTKKIQLSLGRQLTCTSRWVRQVWDALLRKSTPFNADQMIFMMICKCDGDSSLEQTAIDALISRDVSIESVTLPLIQSGYLKEQDGKICIIERGEEAIAAAWPLHEEAERIAVQNLTEEEQALFSRVLDKICQNCSTLTPYIYTKTT